MPLKKSELYSSLWASCDKLRGGMDASQYKDYILVLLFVKCVSDKYGGQKNPLIVVPAGGSFADMVQLKGQKNIGDGMNKIIAKLAEANDLKGVIDVADFNDDDKLGRGKDMVDRLSDLVAIFENPALDFTKNRAEGDDLLGDAYEYLMRHFATESGKSKGQFYTPAEVSRIMAKVIGIGDGHNHLRPNLWVRVAAAQSRGRGRGQGHDLRSGNGQCHCCFSTHEHDPARQPNRRDLAR
jgi:type I restriction enzyme M protein